MTTRVRCTENLHQKPEADFDQNKCKHTAEVHTLKRRCRIFLSRLSSTIDTN